MASRHQSIGRSWEKLFAVARMVLRNDLEKYPPAVLRFERDFAAYAGCQHGLSFCNGTSCLEAALFALDIQPGDRVLVPAFTFHATITPILNAGAEPVFIDVDPGTSNVDLADFERKARGARAAVITHLWGNPVNMDELERITAGLNLPLIEDCSHAHGAAWKGRRVGGFGQVGFFSLQAGKAVSAGEGGIAVTNDRSLFERMSLFGHYDRHGSDPAWGRSGLGYKRRAHPLGLALAHVDLKHLERDNERRRALLRDFARKLPSRGFRLVFKEGDARPGGFMGKAPLVVEEGAAEPWVQGLRKQGVPASRCPYDCWHLDPVMTNLDYRRGLSRVGETGPSPAVPEDPCPSVRPFAERLFFVPLERRALGRTARYLARPSQGKG
ncbi:MAG: aminotransferase class I/II-fold pyridoxal phosphate-dependent enzyme [Verrucomicrobiota bacterium]